jgi:hypothetical protein
MSAYICDREHIIYLVKSAGALVRPGANAFRWFHDGQWHELRGYEPEQQAEAANMLWRENIRSVSSRYPHESSATLPGPRDERYVITPGDFEGFASHPALAQVFKACDCYAYQTCETEDWETTEAMAFINALRSHAWHSLPGYEAAAWGAPKVQESAAA